MDPNSKRRKKKQKPEEKLRIQLPFDVAVRGLMAVKMPPKKTSRKK